MFGECEAVPHSDICAVVGGLAESGGDSVCAAAAALRACGGRVRHRRAARERRRPRRVGLAAPLGTASTERRRRTHRTAPSTVRESDDASSVASSGMLIADRHSIELTARINSEQTRRSTHASFSVKKVMMRLRVSACPFAKTLVGPPKRRSGGAARIVSASSESVGASHAFES